MKLQEFIKNNINHNATVRLLTEIRGGHHCVESEWKKVYMAHEIDETMYKDWQVLYITSIGADINHNSQAVNIVVIDPNPYRNFINNLKADEDMFRAYKDNIAMAFKDNFDENKSLHENTNIAASSFLENLTR